MVRPLVLHTRTVVGGGGGPEKTILNSPRFLENLGYDSLCAYLHPPGDKAFEQLRRRAATLEAPLVGFADRGPLDLGTLWRLVRLCRRRRVTIWHSHDYKTDALGLLAQAFHPMALVSTVHGWGVPGPRTPLYHRLDKWSLRRYRAVLCVSQELMQQCRAAGIDADRLRLIHNAIDMGEYRRALGRSQARAALDLPDGIFAVGAAGRLSPEKDFPRLIEAAAAAAREGRSLELWIAGEGPERGVLEAAARHCAPALTVRLLGHVHDMKTFFQCIDVFALSSTSEGLPNVLLEAMALEVPVVATSVGEIPHVLEDRHSGLLISPGSTPDLQSALGALCDDANLRQALVAGARQAIEQRFSFAARMESVARIYDDLVASKLSPSNGLGSVPS